jgi:hypothetical protein
MAGKHMCSVIEKCVALFSGHNAKLEHDYPSVNRLLWKAGNKCCK